MNVKYKGVWDVYVFPEEAEPLVRYVESLKSKGEKISSFAEKCIDRIKKAFYSPIITIFAYEKGAGKEIQKIYDEIEESRDTLTLDLISYAETALEEKVIDCKIFMDFESYVYDFKAKMEKL